VGPHVMSGFSLLGCDVQPDGHFVHCKVYFEAPPNMGYGDATLAMSNRFRLKPGTFEHTLPVPNRFAVVVRLGLWSSDLGNEPSFWPPSTASLVTGPGLGAHPTADAVMQCLQDTSAKGCAAHPVRLARTPELMASMRDVLKSGKKQDFDAAVCDVGADLTLNNCQSPAPEAQVLLAGLQGGFKVRRAAADDTPTAGGAVVLVIDWAHLYEWSRALEPDPPLAAR